MEFRVIPPKKKGWETINTTICVPEKCLHCDNERAKYCESCYQELIAKNAILQHRVESLEKENKTLKEDNYRLDRENQLKFESIITKSLQDNIEENYISKAKVKNKIKELEGVVNEKDYAIKALAIYSNNIKCKADAINRINVLKEILGEV